MNRNRVLLSLVILAVIFIIASPVSSPTIYEDAIIPEMKIESPFGTGWIMSDIPEGVEYSTKGSILDLGDNKFRYIGAVGEKNTWNGSHWVRYMYDPEAKSVKIGNLTISHLEGGALSIDGDGGSRVGKLSWYIQAYYATQWNNITLDNYQFIGFTKTNDNVSMKQRFWGAVGEMNVTTIYSYHGGFKTVVDIRNDAAQAVPIRAIWVAQNVTGLQDNFELLHDENDLLYGVKIEDATFNWYDVYVSDNPLPVNTVMDKPNRRAAIIFGNMSTVIPAGYTATIDPTYDVAADSDDDEWDIWEEPVHDTNNVHNRVGTDSIAHTYVAQFRISLSIHHASIIDDADIVVYAATSDSTKTGTVKRIAETDVGSLEADTSMPSVDASPTADLEFTGTVGWKTTDVTALVQEQVDIAAWAYNDYIGFRIESYVGSTQSHSIEDWSDGTSYESYIIIDYTNPFPTNDGAECTNLDDSNNLYPQYRTYLFTSNHSDPNGATDVDYVIFTCYNSTSVWSLKYTESSNNFEESAAGDDTYIELVSGSCAYTKAGNDLDLTWAVKIEWAHPDTINYDIRMYVIDDDAWSESDDYDVNYDYDTDVVTTFTLNDGSGTADHGNYDTLDSVTASGTVSYEDSGGNNYPDTGQVDVWVSCGTVAGSPWSDLTLSSGAWSMTVDSDDEIGMDTYYVFVVAESGGVGGTKYNSTTVLDTYIADRVKVMGYMTNSSDNHDDINTGVEINVWLQYDAYDTNVTDGTVTVNGQSFTYLSNGNFTLETANASHSTATWNTVVVAGNEHDVTDVNQNSKSQVYIWDSLTISMSDPTDQRQNIDANASGIVVTAVYDEGGAYDGTFTLNNSDYNGDSTVVRWGYEVATAVGDDTYGITAISDKTDVTYMIWDQIKILTTTVTDGRINYGSETTTFNVTAELEYDSHTLGASDTLYMNGTSMTWDTDHFYYVTSLHSVVELNLFFVNSSSANEVTYTITTVYLDSNSANVIWDRVEVYNIARSHAHFGLNYNGAFYYYLRYDYDNEAFGDMVGYTFTTDTGARVLTQHVSNYYYFTTPFYTHATVTKDTMSTLGSCNETTYGLTTWVATASPIYTIWDSVEVTGISVSDPYVNTGDTIWIQCQFRFVSRAYWADYDYVTGWSTDAPKIPAPYTTGYAPSFTSSQGSGWWRISSVFAPNNPSGPQSYLFNTSLMYTTGLNPTGMVHSHYDTDGYTQTVIWDQLIFTITVGDNRINISTNATIGVSATYQIGGGTYDGSSTLNYTTYTHATVQRQGYEVSSAAGDDSYGITIIGTNDENYVIWDRVYAVGLSYGGDTRVDVGTLITFDYEIHYDYDETDVTDGTITINGYTFTYQSAGIWRYTNNSALVGDLTFDSIVASGNIHGITATTTDSNDVIMIWDQIDVVMGVNVTWTVVNYYVNVSYSGTYEYDTSVWSGYATIANTSLTTAGATHYEELTFTSVFNKTFYATAVEDVGGYGLTVLDTTTIVWCVWDNITATALYGADVTPTSKIFKILFSQLLWQHNSSSIGVAWVCYNIRNETALSISTSLSDGYLNPLLQEVPIPLTWAGIAYSNNATRTVNGTAYDFQWYAVEQIVVATQNIVVENVEILDITVVVSGTTNIDFTWTLYNNNSASGETGTITDEDDWDLTFDMVMTYGNHSYEIHFDGGASGERWFNSTYFVSFEVNIDPPEIRGDNVEVRGIINIACEYWVYPEGAYDSQSGSLTPTTISFFFTKKTTPGLHNYSLYFNVSMTTYIWKNGSYYVDPTWDYCRVRLYNSRGVGLDVNHFVVYVNSTRYYGNEFYGRTDYNYNITVTDYFGYNIYSTTHAYARNLDIGISFYVYKVLSELQGQAVYFNLTRTGGAKFSQHLMPEEIISYYLVAGEYTYEFRKVTTPDGDNYVYYEGTFTLSTDKTHILDGTNLRDLENTIELMPAGKASTKDVEALSSDITSMIGMMQLGMWGLGFMVILGMAATATEETITKDGKIIRKRKIPQQLKRFAFKAGAANPRSKKIPKGAGRGSWTGVVFRDEIDDWRKKK